MSGLADYLAKNYLTADSEKKSKKRKRKNKDAGLIIEDDDNLGWKDKADDDDDDAPMIGEHAQPNSLEIQISMANIGYISRRRHPQEVEEEIKRHWRSGMDSRRSRCALTCRPTRRRRSCR